MQATDAHFDVQDFDREVIEASRMQPLVADFWAAWCGPCRVLGPVLQELAEEEALHAGRWRLAKVNTEQHPQLSARYGIRGIPAVKLFVDGEVAASFTGALPKHAVRQWLADVLPSPAKDALRHAQDALDAGQPEEAERHLHDALEHEPQNVRARLLLAELKLYDAPDEAAALAQDAVAVEPHYLQRGEAVATLARLLTLDLDALPDEPGRASYRAAANALAAQDFDAALAGFIETIQTNRYFDDDGSRQACLALFTLLGAGHPAVRQHRRTFDMSLY